MRIAALGPAGTYSEAASRRVSERLGCPNPELAFTTVEGALRMVQNRGTDLAVVAVENTVDGVIGSTLDSLIDYHDFVKVCDEVTIPIRHALAAPAGLLASEVRAVLSHNTALNQCAATLAERLPTAELVSVGSTAEAARTAAAQGRQGSLGAICSRDTALAAGLTVLDEDIQDYPENSTRFFVCSLTDSPPSGNDRTVLALRPGTDTPGLLYRILGELASRGLNMTFIQSRPFKVRPREYVFILEVEGHKSEPCLESALRAIDRLVREGDGWKKVLGSYPRRGHEA
jgi:prephenate dehydratase